MAFSSTNGFRIDFSINSLERVVKPAVGLFLLTALLLVIYWPGFEGKWFLDDFDNIHKNPNIHAEALTLDSLAPAIYGRDPGHKKINRPVAYLTLAANWAMGGTDPLGYHIVNFLIHVLTAIALYALARITLNLPAMNSRYGRNAHAIALLGTLLWAVHPIQVTAVTYIVQRMAALAALFTLLALIGYVKGRTTEKNRIAKILWLGLCGLFGLLAIGSKQNAVMLPASIYLYDLFFLSNSKKRIPIGLVAWVLLAVAAVAGIAAYYNVFGVIESGYADRPFTLTERLLTQPRALFAYLWWTIYPISSQFSLLHNITISADLWSPFSTLPALLAIVALAILSLAYGRKAPLACFAWLFFLINHLVESTILPLELVFEHRNYLPSTFLAIAVSAGFIYCLTYFSQSHMVRQLLVACGIIVLLSIGHTTYMRNILFTDKVVFWSNNVYKYPMLHRPRHNLGAAYFSRNQWTRGIEETLKALDGKITSRKSQKYESHLSLARFFLHAGMEDEALMHYETVLKRFPRHSATLDGIARIMLLRGDIKSAQLFNDRSRQINNKNDDFYTTTGLILLYKNQPKPAFKEILQALRLNPENPEALYLMGEASRMLGNKSAAVVFFRRSMEIDPETYVPIMSLIDMAEARGDKIEVKKLVGRLIRQAPQKPIGHLLAAYQHRYNFIEKQRLERISWAVKNACPMLAESATRPIWASQ